MSGSGSGSNSTGSSSGSGHPPAFPYPGDGYDVVAWHVYDVSFATLYALLAFAAALLAWRVGRQIRRNVNAGRSEVGGRFSLKGLRRRFYRLVCLQTLMRSVYFVLASYWRDADITDQQTTTLAALAILADAVYFSTFTVLLAYWGMADFTSRGELDRRKLIVRAFFAINAVFYLTLLVFTVIAITDAAERQAVATGFVSVIFCYSTIVALGFLVFAVRMVRKLRKLPTANRNRMIGQVVLLAGICTVCFVYRAIFVLTVPRRTYGNLGAVASYLLAGEVVPLTILLGAFYFLPRVWRGSAARTPDFGIEDDAVDDATIDALLSRHANDEGSPGADYAPDEWVVVQTADPGSPPPFGAKSPAGPSSPVRSYGAVG